MSGICKSCLHRLTRLYQGHHKVNIRSRFSTSRATRLYVPPITSTIGDVYLDVEPQPDMEYLLDPENMQAIRENIISRKGVGDIDQVHKLFDEYSANPSDDVKDKLLTAALLIPNNSKPDTIPGKEPKVVRTNLIDHDTPNTDEMSASEIITKQIPESTASTGEELSDTKIDRSEDVAATDFDRFEDICKRRGLISFQSLLTSNLVYPQRSYFLLGQMARLERVLVKWTIEKLASKGWNFISVPDLLPEELISGCGFVTTGRQNQVYKVLKEEGGLCLAGTSEMAMAGLYAGRSMDSDEPIKLCTYSPCYRAEEARNKIDKGFYRLHQFTKVEMFGICTPDQSEALLDEIVSIQCELFSELDLGYRLLEMPSEELGAPAYSKYDIETWLKGTRHWAEISSASNCTDYQSRRLAITTPSGDFAHTVNGTGCAIPRMLMAIVEQNNDEKNKLIEVPGPLRLLMDEEYIYPQAEFLRCEGGWVKSKIRDMLG